MHYPETESIGYLGADIKEYHIAAEGDTLRRLLQNDPKVQCLTASFGDGGDGGDGAAGVGGGDDDRIAENRDWAKEVGRAISKSKHLRVLFVDNPSDEEDDQPQPPPYGLPSFFMGLAENRSIEDLHLNEFDHSSVNIFTALVPFFEHNNNFRSISMARSTMLSELRIPSLISVLVKTHGLKQIDISYNHLGDTSAADLIAALTSMPGLISLEEIQLGGNLIGQKGCAALRKLLRHPACKIQVLCLDKNSFDDTCMDILYGGLVANNSIKSIGLQCQHLVTASGWGVFFDIFSNSVCSIERIQASLNVVGDVGAISLGDSLAVKNNLKRLDLQGMKTITPGGWRGLSKGLRSPHCLLLALNISRCSIDDVAAVAIASALAENTSLKELDISTNRNISSSGWIECFHLLSSSELLFEVLDLSRNNIDDLGAAMLAAILVKMSTLASFTLEGVSSISTDGWREFADVLKPFSASKLRCLKLRRDSIAENNAAVNGDDVVICFLDALTGNTSLQSFWFRGYNLSDRSRNALTNALCDKSSVASTYSSNHTLVSFHGMNFGQDLDSLLTMNLGKNKAEVARRKILLQHVGDVDACVRVFAPMAVPVLPTALSWIGSNRDEYSLMFRFLLTMPWLRESTA